MRDSAYRAFDDFIRQPEKGHGGISQFDVDLRKDSTSTDDLSKTCPILGDVEITGLEFCVAMNEPRAAEKPRGEAPAQDKAAKNISVGKDNFKKLGDDVSGFLKDAGAERVSLVNADGKDTLVIEFEKRNAPVKKSFDAVNGGKAEVTQNEDGSTKIDLTGVDGCRALKIAGKLVANVQTNKDGTIAISDIKGLKAEVDPGEDPLLGVKLPWVWADVKKVVLKPNPEGSPTIEVTGQWGLVSRTISFEVPKEHMGNIKDLIAQVDKARKTDDKAIEAGGNIEELVKPHEDPDSESVALKALKYLVEGGLLLYVLNEVAKSMRTPAGPYEAGVVGDRLLPRFGELFVGSEGRIMTRSEAKAAPDKVAALRADAKGNLFIRNLDEKSDLHIRTADGDIRSVKPGKEAEIKPGELFSSGKNPEFTPITNTTLKVNLEKPAREGDKVEQTGTAASNKVRFIEGTSMDKPFRWDIGPGRQVTIGREGHLDVGGKSLAGKHAELRVDNSGNAFLRVLPQKTGAPDAVAWIERNGGGNSKLTSSDGWVPLGPRDLVSVGGSRYFSLAERVDSPFDVTIQGKRVSLTPGNHVTIGRGDGTEYAEDGSERVDVKGDRLSRTHARLGMDEKGRLYVEDVGTDGKGSTNGTFVNGTKLKPGEKRFVTDLDNVFLGQPHKEGSVRLDVKEIVERGDRVFGGRVNQKPIENTVRMEPRSDLLAGRPVADPVIPSEVRGSYEIGKVGGGSVRILGGLGNDLPSESLKLSAVDAKALGTDKSPFEKVELTVRGEKVNYYREKGTGRFYLLAEGGREGPKLIRDYEVFIEGGKPPDAGLPKPGGPRPGDSKPGGSAGGASGPDELRIETSPFQSGGDRLNVDRPVAAMEQGKIVEISLPGGITARVAKADLPKFMERVEREMNLDELGKVFEAAAKDTDRPKEERAKWEALQKRYASLDPAQKAECKSEFFAQVRTELGLEVDARPEGSNGSRALKALGAAGAALGIGIIAGTVLRHCLKREQSSTSPTRVPVQFKK